MTLELGLEEGFPVWSPIQEWGRDLFGSLWNVVGFIFVFGLILSAVLRRKEAESCSDEGMKKPPYIRMYGGLRAETAKVIPSVS